MTKRTQNIVRRNIKGQAPGSVLLGRLDRSTGPVQFLTLDDVVTAMLQRGNLGRYISSGGGSGGTGRKVEVVTTSGSQTNVQFAGIDQAYKNLTIKVRGQVALAGVATRQVRLKINGLSSASGNWNMREMINTGVVNTAAGGETSQLIGELPMNTNDYQRGQTTCLINDYTDAATNKSLSFFGSCYSTGITVFDGGGLWNVTGAITQLDVFLEGGNAFTNGSMVELILET